MADDPAKFHRMENINLVIAVDDLLGMPSRKDGRLSMIGQR